MTINVTNKDHRNEVMIMKKAIELYDPFKHTKWKHMKDETLEVFDFHGFRNDVHLLSADAKALYCPHDKYPTNMMSISKWNEFVEQQPNRSHYMVYYYPEPYGNVLRVYDLDKSGDYAYFGTPKVWHKRENKYRYDPVAYLYVKTMVAEFNDIEIPLL